MRANERCMASMVSCDDAIASRSRSSWSRPRHENTAISARIPAATINSSSVKPALLKNTLWKLALPNLAFP